MIRESPQQRQRCGSEEKLPPLGCGWYYVNRVIHCDTWFRVDEVLLLLFVCFFFFFSFKMHSWDIMQKAASPSLSIGLGKGEHTHRKDSRHIHHALMIRDNDQRFLHIFDCLALVLSRRVSLHFESVEESRNDPARDCTATFVCLFPHVLPEDIFEKCKPRRFNAREKNPTLHHNHRSQERHAFEMPLFLDPRHDWRHDEHEKEAEGNQNPKGHDWLLKISRPAGREETTKPKVFTTTGPFLPFLKNPPS